MEHKLGELRQFIAEKGAKGVVIAFSGGVDSSTLAAVSHQVLGDKAITVIAQSPTYTKEELRNAKQTAKDIGIKLYTIQTNELRNPEFTKNPENRCYHCKKELLLKLKDFAKNHGFSAVFEGTNFSDLADHRPGFRAVKEVEDVWSPWVAKRFTKEEIRQLANTLNLKVSDKPPLACLASRIPFNEKITIEKLKRIEKAETTIKKIVPVKQLRVRDHNGLARIEINVTEFPRFFDATASDKIVTKLKLLGFKYVTFDLEGYKSGSMLKTLPKNKLN